MKVFNLVFNLLIPLFYHFLMFFFFVYLFVFLFLVKSCQYKIYKSRTKTDNDARVVKDTRNIKWNMILSKNSDSDFVAVIYDYIQFYDLYRILTFLKNTLFSLLYLAYVGHKTQEQNLQVLNGTLLPVL